MTPLGRGGAATLLRGIGAGRIGLGAAILAATDPALDALGFGRRDAMTRALGRLAGGRDVAVGALALTAAGDDALRRAAIAGLACDACDGVVFAIAAAERGELDRATVGGVASAVAAVAAGGWALAALGRD